MPPSTSNFCLIMNDPITDVFQSEKGQAVHIPSVFRLDSDRVQISRNHEGDLVLHPLPTKRADSLWKALEGFDDEFIRALEEDRFR